MAGPTAPALTKWYVDCVDAAGRSAIVYWSALSWRGLQLSVHNLALHEPGVPARYWGGFSRAPEPEVRGGTLTWRPGAPGWSLTGHALGRPFGLRLFERDEGAVDWQCEACPLRLEITLPEGRSLSGLGYAERLTLGLAPWALPIDELRWGRWIADTGESSMVWIDWRGSHPLTVIFVDGSQTTAGAVGDDRVDAGAWRLALSIPRLLHHRAIRDVVGDAGPLAHLLPEAWLDVQDRKWMSRGTLEAAGAPPATGWAIHEVVRFP